MEVALAMAAAHAATAAASSDATAALEERLLSGVQKVCCSALLCVAVCFCVLRAASADAAAALEERLFRGANKVFVSIYMCIYVCARAFACPCALACACACVRACACIANVACAYMCTRACACALVCFHWCASAFKVRLQTYVMNAYKYSKPRIYIYLLSYEYIRYVKCVCRHVLVVTQCEFEDAPRCRCLCMKNWLGGRVGGSFVVFAIGF